MNDNQAVQARCASTMPADDLRQELALARPSEDQNVPHIGLVGDTYTILLSGEDTSRYCLIDVYVPPGGGPPPHRHGFEESFTLLEGEIEATFRGEKTTMRAGETVNVPANAPHQSQNTSQKPVRLLCLCSPASQEEFFLQVVVPVATRTTQSLKLDAAPAAFRKKAEELAPKYRTAFLQHA
jgi:quercetin dioxygenase-like cupin family protein